MRRLELQNQGLSAQCFLGRAGEGGEWIEIMRVFPCVLQEGFMCVQAEKGWQNQVSNASGQRETPDAAF